MRKKVIEVLAGFALLATSAQAMEITDPRAAKIEGVVTLPIEGIKAVESDGQIFFLSENGRFVITGQIFDVWQRKSLDTLSQMQDVASRINLKNMGLDVDTLNTVSMGQGAKEVTVFVDPQCEPCHRLMDDAKALTDDYTFKFIAVPALGDESNRLAKRMSCAKDPSEALGALMNATLSTLQTVEPCDSKRYDLTLLTAQVLNVKGVPYAISHDGRVSAGRPTDLKGWLEGAE